MLKKIFLFLAVSVLALAASDTITIAQENESDRLNPAYSEDHDGVIAMLFSGLTRFDENGLIAPDLAESWEVSGDGLVYDFKLREGVVWHDGVPFSAKDVKFSIEAYKNPKNASTLGVNFADIKSVEVVDKTRVKITLDRPFPALLDALSEGIIPQHLLKGEDLAKSSFNTSPIGTGVYKLKSWKKGQYMVFEANEKHHLYPPKTKNLIIKIINDPNIAAVELKAGQIDAALIDGSLIGRFEGDKKFAITTFKSADYRALMFNLNNKFLADPLVRRALNHAVNKEVIVAKILHNTGFVAHHPLQSSWAAPLDFSRYDYDIKKSEALLSEAGFAKNKDGLWQKGGEVLSFEIYAMSNDPLRVVMAGAISSDFARLGVSTKVVARVAGSFDYSKTDSFLVGWGSPFDPDFHTYRVFDSTQDSDKNIAGWNYGHYGDSAADTALKMARSTLNKEERKKYYADFIEAIYQNPPFIFLAYLDFSLVHKSDLKGIKPRILGHHGVGFTHNIYEWHR